MPWARNRKLTLLPEAEAKGRTLEIYRETKSVLGVPQVSPLFQAFGAFPGFLDLYWKNTRPEIQSAQFFGYADRLRADAYTRIHNYFEIPDFSRALTELSVTPDAQRELQHTVEFFTYNDPLILLLAAYQSLAFEGHGDGVSRPAMSQVSDHLHCFSLPIHVDEKSAPLEIKKIYEEVKSTLRSPFIPCDYMAFARFPDFLQGYWKTLNPVLSHPLYCVYKMHMHEAALSLASELPGTNLSVEALLEGGVSQHDIDGAIKVTELFLELASGLVLNVALAKIGLEGGTRSGIGVPSSNPLPESSPLRAA